MIAKQDLEKCAVEIADQYRKGLLPDQQYESWPMVWKDLTKTLRKKCPGFSDLEYGLALNQGFVKPR